MIKLGLSIDDDKANRQACDQISGIDALYMLSEGECVRTTVDFTDLVTPDTRGIVVEEGERIAREPTEMVSLDECC